MTLIAEPTSMRSWEIFLHPLRACGEILTAQLYLEAMISIAEPDRFVYRTGDWFSKIITLEDFWKRPIKMLRLLAWACRYGILTAAGLEMERQGMLYSCRKTMPRKSQRYKEYQMYDNYDITEDIERLQREQSATMTHCHHGKK